MEPDIGEAIRQTQHQWQWLFAPAGAAKRVCGNSNRQPGLPPPGRPYTAGTALTAKPSFRRTGIDTRAMRRRSVKAGNISWVAEYQRRMRRFNLIVILAAWLFLLMLIACWWFFS